MRARTLLATSLATAATAVAGSVATDPDGDWFRSLDLPDFYPPAATFPIVWTALYTDLAVAGAVAIDACTDPAERAALRRSLAVNLVLNGTWSWLFWRTRRPWLATVECLVLAGHSALLVRRIRRVHRGAARALVPYPLWCAFATVLNATIAGRNPRD
ncbi:TspO/MBR family protein [Occultella aeris]|uniref:TspO/MBR family protein n=1 Tax=Occultella aeris TaxID=2761496 RepID=A0A7M4DRS9_9MICO|nr:TspO/MBR family protein [Occultella aeris]VZO40173.1 TspO/MBR family protein [Occultella aeris]